MRTTISGQTLVLADSLRWMHDADGMTLFDVTVADPPYCAATRGGTVAQSSATKYTSSGAARQFAAFDGDHRDQRSFTLWTSFWSAAAYRLVRPGGALVVFIDYRNLAAMIDGIQVGGWCYDGVVPWLKRRGRPRLGWYQTSQTEFAIIGRKGPTPKESRKCGPAFVESPAPSKRVHPTQKPVEILVDLLQFRPDWQRILDPFAGSGTTAVAAMQLGRRSTVIESSADYYRVALQRLRDAAKSESVTDRPSLRIAA